MAHVFFASAAASVAIGESLLIDGDEGHHAVRVRRIRIGEQVEAVDGAGMRAIGEISAVAKDSCTMLVERVEREPQLSPQVTVVQALVKRDRSDQVIELLTEVGVDGIIPWLAARSQVSEVPSKWPRLLVESSKQARRAQFPQLDPAVTTQSLFELLRARDDRVLVCHESAHAGISDVLTSPDDARGITIIIGPEGGLTDEELSAFADAGAATVRLGPSVMRAASAGAAAAAIVSALTDRWKGAST